MNRAGQKQYDCFICYRRSDSFFMAKAIKDRLDGMNISCFLDLEESNPGNFDLRIRKAIEQADNFLLLLDGHSLDRCMEKQDWVRQETELALSLKKRIIPIMLTGFSWPSALPASMESIQYLEFVIVQIDYFEEAVMKIVRFLTKDCLPVHEQSLHEQTVRTDNNRAVRIFTEAFENGHLKIAEVNLAFHSGSYWFRTDEKIHLLEDFIAAQIPVRVLVNEAVCIEPLLVHMRHPFKRYVPIVDSIDEWRAFEKRFPALITVRVCPMPLLHRLYAVRFEDGTESVSIKNYRYGDSSPDEKGMVRVEEKDQKDYLAEFDYLWNLSS